MFGFFQRKYWMISRRCEREDRLIALTTSLAGPLALVAFLVFIFIESEKIEAPLFTRLTEEDIKMYAKRSRIY